MRGRILWSLAFREREALEEGRSMKRGRTRIAVLVSGGGTNLQALIDASRRGEIPDGELCLVIASRPGIPALERARAAGIPALTIVRDEEEMIRSLKGAGISLIVLAGFLTILSERFLSCFRDRIINVHPSLIPSFCGRGFYGLRVHEAALKRGVKLTGATVHLVNEIPDGGRILFQRAVEVLEGDSPKSLQRRVMEEAEWKLLPIAVQLMSREISERESEERE